MTQYTLKRGLKEFGLKGIAALSKEMEQLHIHDVGKPVDADSLSHEQKKRTLRYLMFMKEKRCGKIKARGCADGHKKWETTNKQDATSPQSRSSQ